MKIWKGSFHKKIILTGNPVRSSLIQSKLQIEEDKKIALQLMLV